MAETFDCRIDGNVGARVRVTAVLVEYSAGDDSFYLVYFTDRKRLAFSCRWAFDLVEYCKFWIN
ncbi:hypothetical protein GCM10009332_02820 [Shewanella gelidii]|uniref:Uncharacterized protein n=1 Tax=Shewanella gelidii TaxID=1642821 RepID=A0A917JI42_9GAMM|nr:hypothetical protein GCM10009332_02820 [Shewanella gelidii]